MSPELMDKIIFYVYPKFLIWWPLLFRTTRISLLSHNKPKYRLQDSILFGALMDSMAQYIQSVL